MTIPDKSMHVWLACILLIVIAGGIILYEFYTLQNSNWMLMSIIGVLSIACGLGIFIFSRLDYLSYRIVVTCILYILLAFLASAGASFVLVTGNTSTDVFMRSISYFLMISVIALPGIIALGSDENIHNNKSSSQYRPAFKWTSWIAVAVALIGFVVAGVMRHMNYEWSTTIGVGVATGAVLIGYLPVFGYKFIRRDIAVASAGQQVIGDNSPSNLQMQAITGKSSLGDRNHSVFGNSQARQDGNFFGRGVPRPVSTTNQLDEE